MKRLWFLPLLAVMGCATITMNTTCPANSTGVSFSLAGSTIGNTLLSMFGSAASMGMLGARAGETTPTSATMTYKYLAIFGQDSGNLSCISPPPGPAVLTPGPPPAIIH